jgi:glucose-6-phosphate isomerase
MWYHAGDGRGAKDMVILPYKDRLMLLSKYLQQLVMESLGKELDRNGMRVNQGIAVYGNKGSTDQHAYVQQLRDGVNNFFATFLEVRAAREENVAFEVEPGITSGDYLQGFLRGTRAALSENNRESITLTLERVSAFHVGAIIALFERAVGFYASLVNINAYHQPGVEAGKKAATRVLELQKRIIRLLEDKRGSSITAQQAAEACSADIEDAYHVLCHLAGTRPAVQHTVADSPAADTFGMA